MRILVTGGREYKNRKFLFGILNLLHKKYSISVVVHGGARGADSLADEWALENDIEREVFEVTKAEWDKYGKPAGIMRNIKMLDISQPDLVVAFKGNRGTSHMINYALENDYKVLLTDKYES